MKRFWQTEWQGIQFTEIGKLSSAKLAGPEFYNSFYRLLYNKYANYQDLAVGWRQTKEELSEWLANKLPASANVLSVGCGLGYIEQHLHKHYGNRLELHVSDYASDALRWLKDVLPTERIHDPDEKNCDIKYDFIYLSAVDYTLSDQNLVGMLKNYRDKLSDKGQLVLISASFLEESRAQTIIRIIKDGLRAALEKLGLRSRGQFWGWMRNRTEYRKIVSEVGLIIDDGFIDTEHQHTYWISGKLKDSTQ